MAQALATSVNSEASSAQLNRYMGNKKWDNFDCHSIGNTNVSRKVVNTKKAGMRFMMGKGQVIGNAAKQGLTLGMAAAMNPVLVNLFIYDYKKAELDQFIATKILNNYNYNSKLTLSDLKATLNANGYKIAHVVNDGQMYIDKAVYIQKR